MRPPTALFLGTHPDDVEFFIGGTVPWHVERGFEVFLAIATTGEHNRLVFKRYERARVLVRQEEARRAAAVLGIRRVTFLDLVDRRYHITPDAVSQLLSIFRRIRPDKVFAPPFRHQIERWIHDHKEVAWLTRQAMEQYHEPVRYFLYGSYRPNVFFDVSTEKPVADRALREHRTQTFNLAPSLPIRNAVLRWWGRRVGARHAEGVEEIRSKNQGVRIKEA